MNSLIEFFKYSNDYLKIGSFVLLIISFLVMIFYFIKRADKLKKVKFVALAVFCSIFVTLAANFFIFLFYIVLSAYYPIVGFVQVAFTFLELAVIVKLTSSLGDLDSLL